MYLQFSGKRPVSSRDSGLQHHLLLRRGRQHTYQSGVYVARDQGPAQCSLLQPFKGLYPRFSGLHCSWPGVHGLPHHTQVFVTRLSLIMYTSVRCTCVNFPLWPTPFHLQPSQLSYTAIADEMQLADELPMIYTVCIMGFATFAYKRPARVRILIAAALIGLAVFITVRSKLLLVTVREQGLMRRE